MMTAARFRWLCIRSYCRCAKAAKLAVGFVNKVFMQVVREHERRQHQDEAEQERGDVFADGPVHGGFLFHLHLSVNTKNY